MHGNAISIKVVYTVSDSAVSASVPLDTPPSPGPSWRPDCWISRSPPPDQKKGSYKTAYFFPDFLNQQELTLFFVLVQSVTTYLLYHT